MKWHARDNVLVRLNISISSDRTRYKRSFNLKKRQTQNSPQSVQNVSAIGIGQQIRRVEYGVWNFFRLHCPPKTVFGERHTKTTKTVAPHTHTYSDISKTHCGAPESQPHKFDRGNGLMNYHYADCTGPQEWDRAQFSKPFYFQ